MSKYSNEFKLEVVKYYNEQYCGYQIAANKFKIYNEKLYLSPIVDLFNG